MTDTNGGALKLCPFVSAVFSFRNEEDVIPELVSRMRKVFEGLRSGGRVCGHELIFVNDDSNDRSVDVLINAARGRDDIKIINMSRRFGVSECVMAGLEHSSGDAVIYMDADLQDPPEVIPELIEKWQGEGAEVVLTTRRTRAGESKIKLWVTKLGYKILKTISNIDIPMDSGDFRLLSRRVVNELLELREKKPFMRGLTTWVGFKQARVFYDRDARHAGETKFHVFGWKVISNFLDSALISFSDVPLKFAFFSGFIISLGAFIYLALVIVMKLMGLILPGLSAIMAIILFLGGVQLLTIGVLGLYTSSIFNEVKKRPNYIVKDTFGFVEKK